MELILHRSTPARFTGSVGGAEETGGGGVVTCLVCAASLVGGEGSVTFLGADGCLDATDWSARSSTVRDKGTHLTTHFSKSLKTHFCEVFCTYDGRCFCLFYI